MAADKIRAVTQLNDITECCICLKTFTDPRMLPCIHTFCYLCLQDMAEKSNKKPEDEIQCPVCRKHFTLPGDGVQGVQKNFFMASFIEVRNALTQSKMTLPCDICKANNDSTDSQKSEATMRCLVCQENLCEGCCKMHKLFKMSKSHEIIKIGSELGEEEVFKTLQVMNCDIHRGKALDYYCADCKKVVCVSCFVESHKAHDCKDVNTLQEGFRQSIKSSANIIATLAEELQDKRKKKESKEEFLRKIATREREIFQQSKELKDMIDEHTKSLLSSLDEIKNRHLKEIHVEEEELDRRLTILKSFSKYCDELRSKGSASDVCRSKDELLRRAGELEEEHETYIMRPRDLFDVSFQATEFENLLMASNGNIIGRVNENFKHLEDFIVTIGVDEHTSKTESIKINLSRQSDIIHHEIVPGMENSVPAAAVYNNTMFLSGVGNAGNEIWKYNFDSGWKKCGSLVEGRRHHCAEFIGETLYTCGGKRRDNMMKSIEAYNALTEKSAIVGQFKFGFHRAACVAYKGSIYVFGGLNQDEKALVRVQVFNSLHKTCKLLSTPLPRPQRYSRAFLWETNAILLCADTCFIFDLNEKTWQERRQFKTGALAFGMASDKGRIFVIEGEILLDYILSDASYPPKDEVKCIRVSSIVNNEAANWKTFHHLPKSFLVIAAAKLSLVK